MRGDMNEYLATCEGRVVKTSNQGPICDIRETRVITEPTSD